MCMPYIHTAIAVHKCTSFGRTYTKIGIQRRLAWPLRKGWGSIFSVLICTKKLLNIRKKEKGSEKMLGIGRQHESAFHYPENDPKIIYSNNIKFEIILIKKTQNHPNVC